ncbi:hypothetical protein MPSEU_000480600 [Mayamaea pseudoterrestris]|nr:hypothetical protein MPSEU_000480600 [Mayamaea pseudoterrestris]
MAKEASKDHEGSHEVKRLIRYLSERPGWQSYNESDEEFIRECPKVELHVHLDGSFDPDFLWKYLNENPDKLYCLPVKADLPWEPGQSLEVRKLVEDCSTQRKFHNLCTCRGNRSLKAMLNCFEIFLPLVRRDLHLLEQLAHDFVQRQWEQNTVYTEVRYSPFLFADSFQGDASDPNNPISAEQIYEAVTRGLVRGCQKFTITVNQIFCALTWRPDWAMPTLDMALEHRKDEICPVVGIDIAAGEEHFDEDGYPELFRPHYEMIQRAKDENVSITIHAGEASENATENVRRAVKEYGAKRIGHGYRIVKSEEIIELVRHDKIHMEVCPTSSVETGGWECDDPDSEWPTHPAMTMKQRGISFSFSSDDPAVFHTSLAWQYRVAIAKMGMSREDLFRSIVNGIEAAFCSDATKTYLRERLDAYGLAKKVRVADVQLQGEGRQSSRSAYRRSMTETFADRVYVTKSQYF